jgi:putative membrane protein
MHVRPGQIALFTGGVAWLLLALVSPIDVLGDEYLFSAHMLQHLLLVLVVPPMLLLGLPAEVIRRALGIRIVARVESVLGHPAVAWVLAAAVLWVWHLPALYDAALADENVHIVQHLMFLVTATAFWWPILTPLEKRRLGPGAAMAYLLAAGAASSLLGVILTFAPAGLYPAYLQPEDELGLLSLIRQEWGLSAAADQQLGGLLMWVPGGIAYLLAIFAVFARWQSGDSGATAEEGLDSVVPALSFAGGNEREDAKC